eukprot:4840067-Pyramimonas_sp.AAC.1
MLGQPDPSDALLAEATGLGFSKNRGPPNSQEVPFASFALNLHPRESLEPKLERVGKNPPGNSEKFPRLADGASESRSSSVLSNDTVEGPVLGSGGRPEWQLRR